MPTLDWIGKKQVVNHHLDVPFRILEHKYGFQNGDRTDKETKSGNKIIHGDNLEALKALLPEYEGKVKCIYIDPPYNTGNENWIYNDNVNDPKINRWLGEVVGKESEDLTRHDKWLCMMYPRLVLLQKLLSDDGAIFISIDDNEQANLKLMMDEIFGSRNFIGTYFWYKSATPPNLSHKIKKNIEYVIAYSKNPTNQKFYGIKKISKSDDPFTKPQNSLKELHFPANAIQVKLPDKTIKKGVYGTEKFPSELLDDLVVKNGTNENPVRFRNKFIWTQEKLEQEISNETRISINSESLVLSYKKQNYSNEVPPNLINEEVGVDTTENGGRELTKIFNEKVFDFPKTPSLIEYLVNFLCDKDSIILDAFAGSGTTAHAILNLNKDGGKRKFILVEVENYAEDLTAERVQRVIKGYADVPGTGGSFDYYELGPALFTDENDLNELVGIEELRRYIYFTETRLELPESSDQDNNYFLGAHNSTAYYFFYEPTIITTLNYDFLSTIKTRAEQYIIYADNCLLTEQFMTEHRITFKKIPRDISRF
ncbi:MAG: site-specific DNA-methyltransferase [Bacteroidia bacterium]|nr:site-specific DNA-methyltransferase [Bacteroidia bacterium]